MSPLSPPQDWEKLVKVKKLILGTWEILGREEEIKCKDFPNQPEAQGV